VSPETSFWARVRGGLAARPGGRVHPGFFAAALVAVVGLLGLVYGAGGQADPAGTAAGGAAGGAPTTAAATGPGNATFGDITVRGAYIRQPAQPDIAAAYMRITNTGGQPDTLVSAYSGAAKVTGLYNVPAPGTTPTAVPTGQGVPTGRGVPTGPYQLAAGATLTLAEGGGYILLSQLTGPLNEGDQVSLQLTFQRSGQVLVEVPVIPLTAPTPAGGP
jgi:copper(I)-binding protein